MFGGRRQFAAYGAGRVDRRCALVRWAWSPLSTSRRGSLMLADDPTGPE